MVRRGQFATFGLLAKALVSEPNVRVIWDRRLVDRRRQADSTEGKDRRGGDRRDTSTVWANLDYIVVRTTTQRVTGKVILQTPSHDPAARAAYTAARDLEHDLQAAVETTVNLLISGGDPMSRRSLADQVHRRGSRATSPFTIIDRRLASDLFDPELADSPLELDGSIDRLARFAGRGTWLIEEVGDLNWHQQTGLLRFLERRDRESNARWPAPPPRLITGTDYWLFDRVTVSKFRRDLFERLNTIHIVLPPGVIKV